MFSRPHLLSVTVLLGTFASGVSTVYSQAKTEELTKSPIAWDENASMELAQALHHAHELINDGKFDQAANFIVGDDVLVTFELAADDNSSPVALRSKKELFSFLKKLFDGTKDNKGVTVFLDKPQHNARATQNFGIVTEECTVRFRYANGEERVDKLFGTNVAVKYPDGWKFIQWHISVAAPPKYFKDGAPVPKLALLSAPEWTLNDANGQPYSSKNLFGRPFVLIFYRGYSCLHCAEQLQKFASLKDQFTQAGLQIIAVSTDDQAGLKMAAGRYEGGNFPLTLLSNDKLDVFLRFRCYDELEKTPLHGTFVIDGRGRVRWQNISYEPFMDPTLVLNEAKRLLAQDGS